jgi:hypothetical protein
VAPQLSHREGFAKGHVPASLRARQPWALGSAPPDMAAQLDCPDVTPIPAERVATSQNEGPKTSVALFARSQQLHFGARQDS